MGAKGGKRSKGGKRKKGPAKSAPHALAPAESSPADVALAEHVHSEDTSPELHASAPMPIADEPISTEPISTGPITEEPIVPDPIAAETVAPEPPPPEFVGDGLKDESAIDSPYAVPTPAPVEHVHYAGLIRRTAALAFDTIFLALIDIGVFAYLFGRFALDFIEPLSNGNPDPLTDPERAQQTFLAIGALAVFNWLYFVGCECSPLRRTFGMAVFNARLKSVLVDGTLSPKVSFVRANLRFLGRILTALTLGIGFVVSLASRRRQALQDRISKTVVVVE